MTAIFFYLSACSIRNGIRVRVTRLRQPRYLVIALGFILYVGSMMMGRPRSGAFGMLALDDPRARLIAIGITTLLLGLSWIVPVGAALGFTSAEIQFLFPAPIARRALVGYKVGRLLLGAAASGAFITVFIGPPRLLPGLLFAAKSAMVMAVFTLHGAGVTMYRTRAREPGQPRGRRWTVLAAAAILTPLVAAGLIFIVFASGRQLALAPLAALALLAAHAWWIVQSDSAFEEAATDAAEKVNRARQAGHFMDPVVRNRASPFRLKARGPAESAILWKNWLLLGRTSRRTLMMTAIIVGTALLGIAVGSREVFAADLIGDMSLVAVGLVTLMGPAMLRIDLRHDLGHLALIKTWPVSGAALIRGELLAPAAALSLGAGAAIVVGSTFAPDLLLMDRADAVSRLIFATAALLTMTAIIVAQLVVHNGIAVSFPAWADLRVTSGTAAMEVNVRMMIVMYGALLVLAVVLIVPVAAATLAYFFFGGVLLPAALFAGLLLIQSFVATEVIGRILDGTDLQDVVVAE